MNPKEETRQYYLDLLRIICCFLVIVIHVSATYYYDCDIKDLNWNLGVFFDILSRFSVPVFFMISGALFLNVKKEVDIKKLYTKNIFKILLILIVWLPVYAIIAHTYKYHNQIPNAEILLEVLKGSIDYQYQFWFLLPLISIYMCIPFLKKIVEEEKITKYFLILFFIFQILIPSSTVLIGTGYKYKLLNLFSPGMILGYYGYFLLGHYLNSIVQSKKQIKLSYILGIASIIIATLATIIISNQSGTKTDQFLGYFFLTTFFVSIAVFNLAKYKISKWNLSEVQKRWFVKLSNCTMGVYIFHNLIKWIIENHIDIISLNAIIAIPLCSIFIFVVCVIITTILKKIPLLGKYIV